MKKLIALLIGASVISTGAFAAESADQAAPSKSDAVMQQLADNSSVNGAATDATASAQDQAAAPAKKATKHVRHTHHHAKKATAPATDATAPASDAAAAPATN